MRRREFIAGLGGAVALPIAARAQKAPIPVVGYLSIAGPDPQGHLEAAFRQGLRETGFIEDQNVAVEYHFAENQTARLRELAADLEKRNVAAIVTSGTRATTIVKAAVSKTPIIFEVGDDPVRNGLVVSLSRPGGNLTGVNSLIAEASTKLFELIAKVLPNSRVLVVLVSGGTANQLEQLKQQAQPGADAIGRKLLFVTAFTPPELDQVFPWLMRQGADALIVRASPLSNTRREQLVALAARYSIPAIYAFREIAEAGGLMSYGVNMKESFRLVGVYTGRILKGEKSADLPVQQATRFEFVINLKTANALGLTIPETLLATADEVIE
jgi:putative tryptophan/tyrosine transport system substrate-binding protein